MCIGDGTQVPCLNVCLGTILIQLETDSGDITATSPENQKPIILV